jgi:hypothetical protein
VDGAKSLELCTQSGVVTDEISFDLVIARDQSVRAWRRVRVVTIGIAVLFSFVAFDALVRTDLSTSTRLGVGLTSLVLVVLFLFLPLIYKVALGGGLRIPRMLRVDDSGIRIEFVNAPTLQVAWSDYSFVLRMEEYRPGPAKPVSWSVSLAGGWPVSLEPPAFEALAHAAESHECRKVPNPTIRPLGGLLRSVTYLRAEPHGSSNRV